jgi:hypothetical protein
MLTLFSIISTASKTDEGSKKIENEVFCKQL